MIAMGENAELELSGRDGDQLEPSKHQAVEGSSVLYSLRWGRVQCTGYGARLDKGENRASGSDVQSRQWPTDRLPACWGGHVTRATWHVFQDRLACAQRRGAASAFGPNNAKTSGNKLDTSAVRSTTRRPDWATTPRPRSHSCGGSTGHSHAPDAGTSIPTHVRSRLDLTRSGADRSDIGIRPLKHAHLIASLQCTSRARWADGVNSGHTVTYASPSFFDYLTKIGHDRTVEKIVSPMFRPPFSRCLASADATHPLAHCPLRLQPLGVPTRIPVCLTRLVRHAVLCAYSSCLTPHASCLMPRRALRRRRKCSRTRRGHTRSLVALALPVSCSLLSFYIQQERD